MKVRGKLHTPAALSPEKKIRYKFNRLAGLQRGLEDLEMKNLSICAGSWTPDRPARSLVAIPTELYLKYCNVNTLINNALKINAQFVMTSYI